MNILTYAKKFTESFGKSPFNRVDAVILCWLSYYNFPDYLKGGEGVALKDLESRGLLPDERMYADAFGPKTSKRLFARLVENPRFRDVVLSDCREERDGEAEKQYASLCAEISPTEYFLAFRGTDASFVGWKEDFNLACRYPVPSQSAAAEYACEVMRKRPDGRFYVGGHSKGGNLAVYAAIKIDAKLQERLVSVYNFDGPGFIEDIYSERGYAAVSDKIVKIVPKSSFVGMLLETRDNFSIIRSLNLSILQHDPFSWVVKDNDFHYLKRRTAASIKLGKAFNAWIYELSLSERERVVELVYSAVNTLDAGDVNELLKTLYKHIPVLYREYKLLNSDDKEFVGGTLKKLKLLLSDKPQPQETEKIGRGNRQNVVKI